MNPPTTDELLRLARKAWPGKHIILSRGTSTTFIVERLENGCDLPVLTAGNDRVGPALLVLAGELDVAALVAERDRLREAIDSLRGNEDAYGAAQIAIHIADGTGVIGGAFPAPEDP